MASEIEIHGKADVKDATVLISLPGVGFSGPIALNYVIKHLEMEDAGYISSEDFPPVASVHEYIPQHPMRIYQKDKLVAVISDFLPPAELIRSLGKKILQWGSSGGAERIILLDTMAPTDIESLKDDRPVYSVGATDALRAALKKAGIKQVEEGMITGLTGVMLTEAAAHGVRVIGLLSEAHPMFPDVRAAVRLLQESEKLSKDLKVDLSELEKNAEEVEESVKKQLSQVQQLLQSRTGQAASPGSTQTTPAYMYG